MSTQQDVIDRIDDILRSCNLPTYSHATAILERTRHPDPLGILPVIIDKFLARLNYDA